MVVSKEFVCGRVWRFYHKNGRVASNSFRFLPDGLIGGYSHKNEKFWQITQGCLELLNEARAVRTRFGELQEQGDEFVLEGEYLPNPGIILCLASSAKKPRWRINPGTKAALAEKIEKYGWEVGDHTYGVPSFIELGQAKLTIGKYCSIAGGVKIAFGDHRTDTVSTYPFRSLRQYWPDVPKDFPDHVSKGDVRIGNDVWIGSDVTVTSGVTIGDGAVIGARSLVTRDVPPYGIVGGIPAKLIRFRFTQPQINRLLQLRWWDWPDELVNIRLPYIMTADIEAFLSRFEQLPKE